MIPILHDLFQKTEAVGILPSLFHKARITLILELDKYKKYKKWKL